MRWKRIRSTPAGFNCCSTAQGTSRSHWMFTTRLHRRRTDEKSDGRAASRRERMANLDLAIEMAEIVSTLPFEVRLWHAQNIWYEILESHEHQTLSLSPSEAESWKARFKTLGRHLGIAVDELVLEDDGPRPEVRVG